MYKNDRTNENGRTNPIRKEQKNPKTKSKSQKITNVDSAGHQIGRDSTHAQQKRQNAEIAKKRPLRKDVQINETSTIRS